MNETTNASAIFAPLWRRKWLILAVAIVAGVGSYLYYRREPPKYAASTQIYLGNGAEEESHLGTNSGGKKSAAGQSPTQAALINSSIIKEAVHARLRRERKTPAVRAALKGKTRAKAPQKSEFITIAGEARNRRGAALLVNTTAQVYVRRQNQHYRRGVLSAIALARRQLRQIEAGQVEHVGSKVKGAKKGGSGATATLQAATLANKINQLESNLTISQVAQVDQAIPRQSKLTGPHPRSNAIFGFVIGLLLAAFAAYLLGRLDRRMRTLAAIEEAFQTRILTALPAVKRPIVRREEHPAPAKTLREALWRLQTTLHVGHALAPEQNGAVEHNGALQRNAAPRVILCVSADPGDGKSTLVAALALAQSEVGERVAVVEADFRRPVQSRLLRLDGHQGLADVLTGRLTLAEAMQEVDLVRPGAGVGATQAPAAGTTTVVETVGSVSVLVGAGGVANPPALLARAQMAELPRSLADDHDFVLIDAPGPLQVSDAMPLLAAVDGILVVARVGHTRETSAARLMQLLERTPSAPVLGVVANAVSPAEIRKYGVSEQYRRGWRQRLLGR
jgi:Mrp family chromosome partitioning ATPase/capsular polysaccharide biosynthesis protein